MACFVLSYLVSYCSVWCESQGYAGGTYKQQLKACRCYDDHDLEAIKSPLRLKLKAKPSDEL